MIRGVIGAGIGFVVGVLLIAAWGAYDGYTEGIPTRRDLSPGAEAAVLNALIYAVYFLWGGGFIGSLIGGLAGLGSWAVAPWRTTDAGLRDR